MSSSRDSVSAHHPSAVGIRWVAPPADTRPRGCQPQQRGAARQQFAGVGAERVGDRGGAPQHATGNAQRAHCDHCRRLEHQCRKAPVQHLTVRLAHRVDQGPQAQHAVLGRTRCAVRCTGCRPRARVRCGRRTRQPSTVTRLGSNRVAWASASPMVCPPYTRRWPPTRES